MADQGQPLRLPLAVSPENRDETANKDAKIINGFIEQVSQDETWVYKRPGIAVRTATAPGAGRGIYNWGGDIYAVVNGALWKNGVQIGAIVDDGLPVAFTGMLGSTPKLFFKNSASAYTYDPTNGLVHVTSAGYPTATAYGHAYLDGTVYVSQNPCTIRGSGINDVSTWDALNAIQAQIEPDTVYALNKQLVYVVAFKQWSVEVFYDAGNSTGSPLGPVQGAKVNVGCRAGASIQEIEGTLFWVSQSRTGSVSVYLMDNLKAQQISTPAIDRLLEAADFSVVYSWNAKIYGHRFYVLTLKNSNLTLAYDLQSNRWYQWTDPNGNYMPYVGSTYSQAQEPLLLHESNGNIYVFDDLYYGDDGVPFLVEITTPNFDGGTRKRKFMKSVDFVADQMNGNVMTIQKSDDDYQTWSMPREVNLGKLRPRLINFGTFRRRAFRIRHRRNYPLRIKAVELQIELGTL